MSPKQLPIYIYRYIYIYIRLTISSSLCLASLGSWLVCGPGRSRRVPIVMPDVTAAVVVSVVLSLWPIL
jgi:hypothetical protein